MTQARSAGSSRDLVAGGTILGVAMLVANAGNYLLNVFLGRWLTPTEFADANLMVTVMLLVTAVAVSLQLIAARFASLQAAESAAEPTAGVDTRPPLAAETVELAARLHRWAVMLGSVLAIAVVAPAAFWAELFNSASVWPFVVLGLGLPFYLVQAVGRGVLQGRMEFAPLAGTFVWEMLARVGLGIGLVALGFGVTGATAALTASFVVTWLVVRRAMPAGAKPGPKSAGSLSKNMGPQILRYAGPVAVLLFGQIIVNNGDVLISKWSLEPETAGVYAAVALVGRAVFFLSWSVATTLFPASAQATEGDSDQRVGPARHNDGSIDRLLYGGLAVVAGLGLAAVIGAWGLGGIVLGAVFGPTYGGVSGQLSAYALATTLFAMANLIVSHHLAMGRLREAVLLVSGGVLQTVLLFSSTESIDALIRAQLLAMLTLLVIVSISHWGRVRDGRQRSAASQQSASRTTMTTATQTQTARQTGKETVRR